MELKKAKCPNCGASIEVDEFKKAGVCKYCGEAFITEEAISNAINVTNNVTNNITSQNVTIQGYKEKSYRDEAKILLRYYENNEFADLKDSSKRFLEDHPDNPYSYLFSGIASIYATNNLINSCLWCEILLNNGGAANDVAIADINNSYKRILTCVSNDFANCILHSQGDKEIVKAIIKEINLVVTDFDKATQRRGIVLPNGAKSLTNMDNPRCYLSEYLVKQFPNYIKSIVDAIIESKQEEVFLEGIREIYINLKTILNKKENIRIKNELASVFEDLERITKEKIEVEEKVDPEHEKEIAYKYQVAEILENQRKEYEKKGLIFTLLGFVLTMVVMIILAVFVSPLICIFSLVFLIPAIIFVYKSCKIIEKKPHYYLGGHCSKCHESLENGEYAIKGKKMTLIDKIICAIDNHDRKQSGREINGERTNISYECFCPYCGNSETKSLFIETNSKVNSINETKEINNAVREAIRESESIPYFKNLTINNMEEIISNNKNKPNTKQNSIDGKPSTKKAEKNILAYIGCYFSLVGMFILVMRTGDIIMSFDPSVIVQIDMLTDMIITACVICLIGLLLSILSLFTFKGRKGYGRKYSKSGIVTSIIIILISIVLLVIYFNKK